MSGVAGLIASFTPATPIAPYFPNGSFGQGEFGYNPTTALWEMNGWAISNVGQVWLNGVSTIQGYPTPTDPNPTPYLSPGERTGSPMTYNFEMVTADLPPGQVYPPDRACRLYSDGKVSAPYGIVNGPYLVSTTAVTLNNGDTASFWWKAANGSDAYNIIAYLLNIATGGTIIFVRAVTNVPGDSTAWAQVSKTINTGAGDVAGNYKFVFISGSYDATGVQALGASLYVTNISVTKA